jgi:hypothetical protein
LEGWNSWYREHSAGCSQEEERGRAMMLTPALIMAVSSTTTSSASGNGENSYVDIKFPWGFSLYTSIAALLVFWFLLYATQNLAFFIETIVNWRIGRDKMFKLGSINFAFLGGKMFLHNLHYVDQDMSIRILAASIGFRWWINKVCSFTGDGEKESEEEILKLPCRMALHIAGLKVVLYCNSQKYELLRKSSLKRNKAQQQPNFEDIMEHIISQKGTSDDQQKPNSKTYDYEIAPLFYRMSPVTKIIVQDFVFEAGNPKFQESLKFTSKFFDGRHQLRRTQDGITTKFSCETLLNARNVNLCFQRNPDFDASDNRFRNAVASNRHEEDDIIISALFGFRNFFMNKVLTGFPIKFEEEKDPRTTAANSSIWYHKDYVSRQEEGPVLLRAPQSDEKFDSSTSSQESTTSVIFEAEKVEIEYFYDLPWRIRLKDCPSDGPKSGLTVNCFSHTTLTYGPWNDSQRSELLSHFLPFFYEHSEIYQINPGMIWEYVSFETTLNFKGGLKLEIPFRRYCTSSNPIRSLVPRTCILEIESLQETIVQVKTPFLFTEESGGSMDVKIEMNGCRMVPLDELELFDQQTLLETTRSLVIGCDFEYPLQWNGHRVWKYSIACRSPKLWFLKDHVSFLTDLSADWTSYGTPATLEKFVPVTYDLDLSMSDSEWLFYCAENNVVKSPETLSNIKAGAFICLTTPEFTCNVCAPFKSFKPTCSESFFQISFKHANCELSLPDSHPLSELMKSKSSKHFLYVRQTDFVGSYSYFNRKHPENVDSLVMIMDVGSCLFKHIF